MGEEGRRTIAVVPTVRRKIVENRAHAAKADAPRPGERPFGMVRAEPQRIVDALRGRYIVDDGIGRRIGELRQGSKDELAGSIGKREHVPADRLEETGDGSGSAGVGGGDRQRLCGVEIAGEIEYLLRSMKAWKREESDRAIISKIKKSSAT